MDVDAVAEAIKRVSDSGDWPPNEYYRAVAVAAIEAMGLEREEMHLPTGPEYLVESVSGGEGVIRYGGQMIRKNPDLRYVPRYRYVTEWADG